MSSIKHLLSQLVTLTICLLLLTIITVPRVYADPVSTIAAAISAFETLRPLVDGEPPDTSFQLTREIKDLVVKLHDRLDGYDRTFTQILLKLEGLPTEIRRELDQSFDVDQVRKVRAAIQLVESDIRNGTNPIGRLSVLQTEAQTLLNHASDFIFFDSLAAMYVEHVVIAMKKGQPQEKLREINNRRHDYHGRFRDMLIPWEYTKQIASKKHYESLPETIKRAETALQQYRRDADSIVSRDQNRYAYYSVRSNCGAYQCYGDCTELYTLLDTKVRDTQEQLRRTIEAMRHVENSLWLLRNMRNAIQVELGGQDNPPEFKNIATEYEEKKKHLRLYGKLAAQIRKTGHCPHG